MNRLRKLSLNIKMIFLKKEKLLDEEIQRRKEEEEEDKGITIIFVREDHAGKRKLYKKINLLQISLQWFS